MPCDLSPRKGLAHELLVVAPEGDSEEAEAFARRVGAKLVTVSGPSSVADAIARVLE